MNKSIRLLITDQNTAYTTILAEILSSDPRVEIVGRVKDGAEACKMLETLKPNILLMDIMLPRIDGIALLKCVDSIRSHPPFPNIIPAFKPASAILENRIAGLLHKIGIPAHIKGYHYMLKAIAFTTKSHEGVGMITKVLYPRIAQTFKTTPSRVERALRHAIEVAWNRSDPETLQNILGHSISNEGRKPTNSEFIAMISEQLRTQLDEG